MEVSLQIPIIIIIVIIIIIIIMFLFFLFFYETFLLLFLTKFLYEIANVSFYFIMYTDILHIIRILSISQFCLRELLRSLLFFYYLHSLL